MGKFKVIFYTSILLIFLVLSQKLNLKLLSNVGLLLTFCRWRSPVLAAPQLMCGVIIWVLKIFLYSSSRYSCHLFLISSASVRSIPFLLTPNSQSISPPSLSLKELPSDVSLAVVSFCTHADQAPSVLHTGLHLKFWDPRSLSLSARSFHGWGGEDYWLIRG